MTIYADPKLIGQFFSICHSNWHRCCYVKCQDCRLQSSCKHPDFLFIPDDHALPVPMLLCDITILFSMHPEPEECLFHMTLQEFFKWYEPYLQTQKLPTDTCPILHLQKQMENTLYNW